MKPEDVSHREPIAIVGIGCRLPGAIHSPAEFWEFLCEGKEAITEIPADRWDLDIHFNPDPENPGTQHVRRAGFIDDLDQFDPAFFGITPREAVCMDPQQRLMLEVAWRALEDANQPLHSISGSKAGVFIGISSSDYSSLLWASSERYTIPYNEPFILPGNTGCITANRISYFLDLKGPSFTVDTACSSSLVAVHLACESIWRGDCDSAFAGGVQALIHAGIQTSFCKAGLLSPEGRCKSFDASADGYVRSEGAGVVLLKPLSAAKASGNYIYALIHGTAVNSDGRSNGMVAPNVKAQTACIREAFTRAGIRPAATQYVEAHGTGTRQGDPIELRALGTVLSEGRPDGQYCRVGSVKTNLGHSETAAGITGLIKAALCVANRQLVPNRNFKVPNPSIDFSGLKLKVQTTLESFPHPDQPLVVGVSSFGFGGTNAHVVLADTPANPAPVGFGERLPVQLLTLSARTPAALAQLATHYAAFLKQQRWFSLGDLAASLNQCRSAFRHRAVCIASDSAQLLAQLEALQTCGQSLKAATAPGLTVSKASNRPGKLAWLFTGQGSQTLRMGQGLKQHPVYKQAFERVSALLDPQLPTPLGQLIDPIDGDGLKHSTLLNQTGVAQPAIFAVGYALSALWQSWGIKPDLLMGHSIGEVLAAHLAGVFSLEDACHLVAARGRLMQALPPTGGMAALLTSAKRLKPLLERHPALVIAAYNTPTNTVVSGPTEALQQLVAEAQADGIGARGLAVSHAFHSEAMAAVLPAFEQELERITLSAPRLPLVSTLTGRLAGAEIAQPAYWCDQLLNPVRFAEGVNCLISQGVQSFLEIGAKPTLSALARQCCPEATGGFWPSLIPDRNDWDSILNSLGGLWRAGYPVDWCGFHRPFAHRRIKLPGYPFQSQRYWWSRQGDGDRPSGLWLDHLGLTKASGSAPSPEAASEEQPVNQLRQLDLPGDLQIYEEELFCNDTELQDHRIRGVMVFPAAGFITDALSTQLCDGVPITLGPLQLEQPLRLQPAPGQRCGSRLLQLHRNENEVVFYSRARVEDSVANTATTWQCHGRAGLKSSTTEAPFASGPAPAGATELNIDGFYAALHQLGLQYGSRYRALRRLQVHDQQAWAELERPSGGTDRGLIDSCFQAVGSLLSQEAREEQLLLPVGLERLLLAKLPLPDQLHCQVQLKISTDPAFVMADLVLHDGNSTLGWISGFRLRRVPRTALEWLFPLSTPEETSQSRPADWLMQLHWQQATLGFERLANTPSPEPIRIGIGDPIPMDTAPILLWPDLAQPDLSVEALAAQLLSWAQNLALAPSRPVWMVVEGEGPLAGAAGAFARSAALEQLQLGWTLLYLPSGEEPSAADWPVLLALGAREPVLAWREGQAWRQRLERLPKSAYRIESQALGNLDSLKAVGLQRRAPGPGELELAVEATGLNFRDVLNALGLLAHYSRQLGMDEQARMPFGGECVGRVVAVGPGVNPGLIGQRLLGALAIGSLASHVVCRAELCAPLPTGMDPELGASISTAFLTAIYGLQTLAGLQAGETVLIHAAAGGVGQAAIQVAHRCGARVFATASASKQAQLLEQGVEAVFDSRSLQFADQVREATAGRGVDVVLNSLKGDWVDASFSALAEGGRFVELGKIDIWSRQYAAERRPDALYLPFDLLEVAAAEPQLIRQLLLELLNDHALGYYKPLMRQTFSVDRTEEAFRLMAQARHVGKVVISHGERRKPWVVSTDATVLVSGAFGAIGRQLCNWLADRGARSMVLVGRGCDPRLLGELEQKDVHCTAVALDLASNPGADEPAFMELVQALRRQPLGAIFHAAGCIDDGLLENQTPARQAAVFGPKWSGWQCLQAACEQAEQQPGFSVIFSSMAALLGSPGQTSYAAANGALDGMAQQHDAVLSVQWGPWAGDGMASGLERRFQALGVGLLPPEAALEALSLLLERGKGGCVAVLDNNWQQLAAQLGHRQAALLEHLSDDTESLQTGAEGEAMRQELLAIAPEQRIGVVVERLQERLALVMGLEDSTSLDPGDSLYQLGLDSLMAVEMAAGIHRDLGVNLELESLAADPTIETLARLLLEALMGEDSRDQGLDLGFEAKLPASWVLTLRAEAGSTTTEVLRAVGPQGAVLLTGASGFLGAYLLAGQLSRWPELEVRCLVRADNAAIGYERIQANLRHYGLWQDDWAQRIIAVPGDLSKHQFGLDAEAFAALASGLGGILHNGAQLSQMATYSQLQAVNVGGTQTVLNLAVHPSADKPLAVHMISSVAVFEATAYRNREILETDEVAEWQGIHLGYSQTKWVSERRVLAAGALGLPVTVYRPPLIAGHSKTGAWHKDDLLHRLLLGSLALGMAPDVAWELDIVPVDYVADAITALAWMPESVGCNFHLQHPVPILFRDLLNNLIKGGAPVQIVSMERWLETIQADPSNPLYPLLTFFVRRWGDEQLTYPEMNQVGMRARPSCQATMEALAARGVHCPSFKLLIAPYARSLTTELSKA